MKEEFDRLIYDFLSGSITKEDLHKLNEWIYSDPENQKYFEQQKRIWLLSSWSMAESILVSAGYGICLVGLIGGTVCILQNDGPDRTYLEQSQEEY